MANVYVEPRPKGRLERSHIDECVVGDHADPRPRHLQTQREAIDWAKIKGHAPIPAELSWARAAIIARCGEQRPIPKRAGTK
jgi:hypothetical protein